MKLLISLALLMGLTLPSCAIASWPGSPSDFSDASIQAIAELQDLSKAQIAIQLHPRNALADEEDLPDTMLDFLEDLLSGPVEFIRKSGSGGAFLVRLVDARDYDDLADAANAIRMAKDVLWVRVIPDGLSLDEQLALAASELALPNDSSGEYVTTFRVVFHDPTTHRARSRADGLPLALIASVQQATLSDVRLARPMSGNAWVFEFPHALPIAAAEAAMERLRILPKVESAHISRKVSLQMLPNDPFFPPSGPHGQYNLQAPGSAGPFGGPVIGIDAPGAWNITTGSANTVVAVLDTGVLFSHPELNGKFLPGYDVVDGDNNATDPGDYCEATGSSSSWHGSHVSGIIAARTNNGIGIAGIDWNTRILPLRVLGQCGGTEADVIDGLRWAAGIPVPGLPTNPNPARVINLSLAAAAPCDSQWQSAINQVIASGALVIAAAGNQNGFAGNYRPGSCSGVITVVASDPLGSKASYSNYGSPAFIPELAAPGGDISRYRSFVSGIISSANVGAQGPTTNSLSAYQGTSMAAPHVAGVASLMLAVNPALTASQLYALITNPSNLTPFPESSDLSLNYPLGGRGVLNALKAVQAAQASLPPPATAHPMLLRDAIYLYDQPLNARGDKVLAGVDCDVFQLVLDVKAGRTDLAMGQAASLAAGLASAKPYPDRIVSSAAMFAYSLYGIQQVKSFTFNDQTNLDSADTTGSATVFGYCFSRSPQARVYLHEKDLCQNTYSDGRTTSCNDVDNGIGGGALSSMTLRDAIYLYDQDIMTNHELQLAGSNCDVLQLVLDVESGYSDIMIYEGSASMQYPDRILASADMFAYALYSNAAIKRFGLGDRNVAATNSAAGKATAFGYCYSTRANAFVFRRDTASQTCSNSANQPIACPN